MREVFKPDDSQPDPGRVFYTITAEDTGNRYIKTTAGIIDLQSVIGYVQKGDVGKRLYRVPGDSGDWWLWQAENDAQRDKRLSLKVAATATAPVHKAAPGRRPYNCGTCGQRIKRVPGGQGMTWVHADSGAVAAPNPDTPPEDPDPGPARLAGNTCLTCHLTFRPDILGQHVDRVHGGRVAPVITEQEN